VRPKEFDSQKKTLGIALISFKKKVFIYARKPSNSMKNNIEIELDRRRGSRQRRLRRRRGEIKIPVSPPEREVHFVIRAVAIVVTKR